MNFEGLDNLPDLNISTETTQVIKTGTALAQVCRKHADEAIKLSDKMEDYAEQLRRLAVAYAKMAKAIIDDVGETVSMEWDLDLDDEDTADEEVEDEQ